MYAQPRDLERAGPSMDSQRDDQYRTKESNNTATTPAAQNTALVDAWMRRIQTLTVVTTFLASIDGELFTLTNYQSSKVTVPTTTGIQEFMYSCFAGALVFHVCAAILGYVASFALIKYQLVSAETANNRPELSEHAKRHLLPIGPTSIIDATSTFLHFPGPLGIIEPWSRTFTPPLPLLTRCYYTILVMSGVGFIADLMGIATYAWEGLQRDVGIFTVGCLGVSVLASVWAIL